MVPLTALVLVVCISYSMQFQIRHLGGSIPRLKHAFNIEKNRYQKFQSQVLRMSTSKSGFYITTPIYYVNGDPHLGHAYTSVVSDIISRYEKKFGKDVLFLTGTDEHGQKVEQSAFKANKTPLAFADEVSERFKNLVQRLNCQNDVFFRTTEKRHYDSVTALWKRLEENGEIYLGSYEGWYSVRDETFYSESELIDGKAPTGADVEWVKEESYFFRLSQWTDKLLAFYEANPDFIGPNTRRNEVINFVRQEGGLKDLSISRTSFHWGIPVPNNDTHVIYVWLDALTNYITALGYPNTDSVEFKKFWPANVHVVGKDILRFHAVFWPAFLMAAGLEPPKKIFAHGWWTRDGEKMSKSVGNVVEPFALVDKYGADNVRYFLASEINLGNDGDFSDFSFNKKVNELANDLGNLLQRVLTLIKKSFNGQVPVKGILTPEDEKILQDARNAKALIAKNLENLNVKGICDITIEIARDANRYINIQEPWKLAKTDKERMATVLAVLYEVLRIIGIYFEPVIPDSSRKLLDQLGASKEFTTLESIDQEVPAGTPIGTPSVLFPKFKEEK
eukprot:gene3420-3644_t